MKRSYKPQDHLMFRTSAGETMVSRSSTIRAVIAIVGTATVAACASSDGATGPGGRSAELAFLLLTPPGNVISTISVEVTGPGIDSALVFNLTIAGSVATGSVRVPAGAGRRIVARAFDISGVTTHRGDTTITLVEGANASVSLVMQPLVGTAPLTLSFGTTVVAMNRQDTAVTAGDTLRFAAAAYDWRGVAVPVDSIRWASSNPGVASVSVTGLATSAAPGTASIVATYEGAVARRTITVLDPNPLPAPNLIFFQSARTGASEIYSIRPEGSGESRMTVSGGETPDLSPDNRTIAFVRGLNIWLMNVDGAGQRQLTSLSGQTFVAAPRWSPDGTLIAFWMESGPTNQSAEIYVIRADGLGLRQLTSNSVADIFPFWMPDGRVTWTRQGESIRAIRPDGTGDTVLVSMPSCGSGSGGYASFSPDGTKILFEGTASCGAAPQTWVMNADGSNRVPLTTGAGSTAPSWSPDGSRIVFSRWIVQGSPPFSLYVMNADGSNLVPLTSGGSDGTARWR